MKFKIDPKVEAETIYAVLKKLHIDRIIQPVVLKKIKKKGKLVTKKKILLEIEKFHAANRSELIKIKTFVPRFWKEVSKRYVYEIQKLLETKIDDDKTCYFTPTISGLADTTVSGLTQTRVGRKNIFIGLKLEKVIDYIFLHELTHLHYSDKLMELGGLKFFYKAGKAPLMEGVDHLIIFKTPIKHLLQSGVKYEKIQFVKQNRKFMKKLEKLWKDRENFESFLGEAIKLNENTKGVKII